MIDGLRPPRLDNCEEEYCDLMESCWQEDPNARPDFDGIAVTVSNLIARLKPKSRERPPSTSST